MRRLLSVAISLGAAAQLLASSPPPDFAAAGAVETLWQETLANQGRDTAIRKLCELAADERQPTDLRSRAVRKLAAVEALSATNLMQSIERSISKQRDPNDKDEAATEYTQKFMLSGQANLAYYQLRFAAAENSERKYKVLTSALESLSYMTSNWAADQLVLRGEERVLDFVRTHRTEFSDEKGRDLLRRKFAIMKSAESASAALKQTATGDHPQLNGLSALERRRLQSWAARMNEEHFHASEAGKSP